MSIMHIDHLRNTVVEFCKHEIEQSHLPDWWRDPLLVTAEADQRFDVLPEIAAPNHMRPRDLLASCNAVVVFFIPFSKTLSNGNIAGKFPSDGWGLSLSLTNDLIQRISETIRQLLDPYGYRSELTPATYNFDPECLAICKRLHIPHMFDDASLKLNEAEQYFLAI